MIKVLALDPSKTALGMASLAVDPATMTITPLDIHVETTEKSKHKQVRKNSDDLRRARQQYVAMAQWVEWADIIMTEVPSGSQSAAGMFSNGVCIGLLASINKPLIQVMPDETKKASVGAGNASKAQMIAWAVGRWPALNWKRYLDKPAGRILAVNEHCADAIAVGHAGVRTDEFQAAVKMMNAMA